MKNINWNFQDKNVVVTGGAQGIGFEITKSFLTAGAKVAVWDYSTEAMEQAKKELSSFGDKVQFVQVDVSRKESCEKAAQSLSKGLDILINNAGITRDKSFSKLTHEDFDAVIQTNLTGLFNVTKSVFEKFNDAAGATKRIINMASVVALYGNFGQSNYVAAKAGVIGLTKTWSKEFAKKGFTVNAIAPGFTLTKMVQAMPEEALSQMCSKIPAGRLGETSDIANACLFLSSLEAGYITGTVISVDGGLVI
jgi:3-oxoacyl-[acyl-carrier protein] reductase